MGADEFTPLLLLGWYVYLFELACSDRFAAGVKQQKYNGGCKPTHAAAIPAVPAKFCFHQSITILRSCCHYGIYIALVDLYHRNPI